MDVSSRLIVWGIRMTASFKGPEEADVMMHCTTSVCAQGDFSTLMGRVNARQRTPGGESRILHAVTISLFMTAVYYLIQVREGYVWYLLSAVELDLQTCVYIEIYKMHSLYLSLFTLI